MKEVKEAIFTKITELLAANALSKVKVYPKNQAAPKAKMPYIVYDFTLLGATDKNSKAGLVDIIIYAKNKTTAQTEAEIIADVFTIEGKGFENDTLITVTNKLAVQFNLINRFTPELQREKIKSVNLTFDSIVDDPRSVLDNLLP